MKPRASNCFDLAELVAITKAIAACERGDTETARRYAQSKPALRARRKLNGMRDRLSASNEATR